MWNVAQKSPLKGLFYNTSYILYTLFYIPPTMMQKSTKEIETLMRDQLSKVIDPELGVSLVDLGLIYETSLSKEGIADIRMTLTTMGCPLFPVIQKDIENHLLEIPEVNEVVIELTFDPPWNPSMMTDEAKAQLGWN